MKKTLFYIFILLATGIANAQVQVKVDTTQIRIGEQITYEISTPKKDSILFPKLQLDSLKKLEVVHSLPVDTLKDRLYKKYILTSFDSGTYTLPAQEVYIDKTRYITDSILINVGTVVVDTTKQGLYPIKGIYQAPPKTWRDYLYYIWWVLGTIAIIGIILWVIFSRKKQIAQQKIQKLSPIEEAKEHFHSLDDKHLIEQQKIKEYYIELTDIVRNYIGKDVKIPTLEVTSDELITLLSLHNKSKNLGIDKERIKELHSFLKNADLVKFAKAKPEEIQINEDRQTAEKIIQEIQTVIHKPVLDEFGNEIITVSEEELQAKIRKKRKLKIILIGLGILILLAIAGIAHYGYTYVKDTITGHPTKELVEGKWYHSSYGYPAVTLETPKVLKAVASTSPGMVVFNYGSLASNFHIQVITAENTTEQKVDMDMVTTNLIQMVENQKGITGFTHTEEDFEANGVSGKKITGSFKILGNSMQFDQYIFVENNNIQMVLIEYNTNDIYAPKIAKRIEKSIQPQKIQNDDDAKD